MGVARFQTSWDEVGRNWPDRADFTHVSANLEATSSESASFGLDSAGLWETSAEFGQTFSTAWPGFGQFRATLSEAQWRNGTVFWTEGMRQSRCALAVCIAQRRLTGAPSAPSASGRRRGWRVVGERRPRVWRRVARQEARRDGEPGSGREGCDRRLGRVLRGSSIGSLHHIDDKGRP